MSPARFIPETASPGTSAWVVVSLVGLLGLIVRFILPKIDLDLRTERERLKGYDEELRERLRAAEAERDEELERRIAAEQRVAVLEAQCPELSDSSGTPRA